MCYQYPLIKTTNYYTDNELLQQWQQGRESAFEALYKRFHNELLVAANARIKNIDAARDVVQEAFITFYLKKDMVSSNPLFYLKKVLRFKVLKYYETRYKGMVENYDPFDLSATFEEAGVVNSLNEKETSALITQSLNKLPSQQRMVFLMSRQLNMSNKQIAHEMDISIKGVEAHITKALKHLRKELKYAGMFLLVLLERI